MNKKYQAVLINNQHGVSWAVECEHLDDDFRVEVICRTNNHNALVGNMWAARIADALNQQETTSRVNAEHSSAMTWLKH